ncbi:MAG: hypothetical protein ACD_2C00104G0002 [uncultured bacterium (gcode 4)]|uniref:Uncharacterized protein n=1 Tax=uncultured bacterium (gcode 4) TaxID=1234023 RepID=K2GH60_9BACT|nr:MAG: hypothetical protein ACD_2C00104G0002 [uncultured bacterium (gcode 4)]
MKQNRHNPRHLPETSATVRSETANQIKKIKGIADNIINTPKLSQELPSVEELVANHAARDSYEAEKLLELKRLELIVANPKFLTSEVVDIILGFVMSSIGDYKQIQPKKHIGWELCNWISFWFAETSFELLKKAMKMSNSLGIDISAIKPLLPDVEKLVTEVTIKEALLNVELCIKETSSSTNARFTVFCNTLKKAEVQWIDIRPYKKKLPALNKEAKRCLEFRTAFSTYKHPGKWTDRAKKQHDALNMMANTAKTLENWVLLAIIANKLPYDDDSCSENVKDISIFRLCLGKLRKSEGSREEWNNLLEMTLSGKLFPLPDSRNFMPLLKLLEEKAK